MKCQNIKYIYIQRSFADHEYNLNIPIYGQSPLRVHAEINLIKIGGD